MGVQFLFKQVSCLQEQVTDLIGKSSDAGKKVYSATMYIPNMALELSGDVIISAKELVFALHKVNEVKMWSDLWFKVWQAYTTPTVHDICTNGQDMLYSDEEEFEVE